MDVLDTGTVSATFREVCLLMKLSRHLRADDLEIDEINGVLCIGVLGEDVFFVCEARNHLHTLKPVLLTGS